jgi:sugar phosphate permease
MASVFQEAVTASPRIKRIHRHAIGLITLGCALNYIDRSTLAIANPLIRRGLGFAIAEMSLLLSAFLWAYAIAHRYENVPEQHSYGNGVSGFDRTFDVPELCC